MEKDSRIAHSLINIRVGILFLIAEVIIRFFTRKIFIDYLGTEILGLNTTAINILAFINLAELGVDAAVKVNLYKPFFRHDYDSVKEIIALEGYIYRRISVAVIIIGLIVMCFFPWIFAKMELPLWYAYASFGALMFSSVIGNFVNYRQVAFYADQKQYHIQYAFSSLMLLKLIFQALAVKYLEDGYVWWLVFEVIFAVLGALSLRHITRKHFPFLGKVSKGYKELIATYRDVSVKIKQLFFHKVGSFALTETTPLIIYSFISLNEVTLYMNYYLIINNVLKLCDASVQGVFSSTGNLVAEGDRQRCVKVFEEIFYVRFIMAGFAAFGLLTLVPAFICNWIGDSFLLSPMSLLLMVALIFIRINRFAVDSFINGYGLFSDTWAPIAEAVTNVSCSIIGGYIWGLNGILLGCLSGTSFIILLWKPYFLFKNGFKTGVGMYYRTYAKCMLIFAASCIIVSYLLYCMHTDPATCWTDFVVYAAVASGAFPSVMIALMFMFSSSMRNFAARFITSR